MIRLFLLSVFSLIFSFGLFAKSNVVVFLTDDQGWGDLSLNGNTNLSTPNIDSLGKNGASFDRFYVCPVCSPTRAEFLTGRHHVRSGVYSTSAGGERMDLDETTVADLFQKAGYAKLDVPPGIGDLKTRGILVSLKCFQQSPASAHVRFRHLQQI